MLRVLAANALDCIFQREAKHSASLTVWLYIWKLAKK
jgi:hypothetical protein